MKELKATLRACPWILIVFFDDNMNHYFSKPKGVDVVEQTREEILDVEDEPGTILKTGEDNSVLIGSLNSEIETLKTENETLNSEIETLKTEISAKEDIIAGLQKPAELLAEEPIKSKDKAKS